MASTSDLPLSSLTAEERRFLERFPAVRCADIKEQPAAPEKSPAAVRLGLQKPCPVYIVAAVEILEEMLAEN